jgi:hypothetical protein
MPFFVEACIDDHYLSVTAASAKQAFAEAVDWHIAKRLVGVTITDGEGANSRGDSRIRVP